MTGRRTTGRTRNKGAREHTTHPVSPLPHCAVLPATVCHRDAWPILQAVTTQRLPGQQDKGITSAARQLPSEGEDRACVKGLCFETEFHVVQAGPELLILPSLCGSGHGA